jgi:alpha/beta superfamily hydrolase
MRIQRRIRAIKQAASAEGYLAVTATTPRGSVEMRFYEQPNASAAVLMVGGEAGNFDSPARNLYPRLAAELRSRGIASLHVKFRNPTDFHDSVYAVLTGIDFLIARRCSHIGLIGHSFGGAVVISAGALSTEVVTVVTLAPQSYGTNAVAELTPRSLLMIRGEQDETSPASSAKEIFQRAREPKELHLVHARHSLEEAADEVYATVSHWLVDELRAKAA